MNFVIYKGVSRADYIRYGGRKPFLINDIAAEII